jgi:hypothetical protein
MCKDKKLVCNGCGKQIEVHNGMPMEGVFRAHQVWQYMSGKDGQVEDFVLCEECYDRMTEQFVIPQEKKDLTEML